MLLTKLFSIFCLGLVTALPAIAEENINPMSAAQQQVVEYKAMRRMCTVMRYDDKQQCFRELSELTNEYKAAKKELLVSAADNTKVVIGFVE